MRIGIILLTIMITLTGCRKVKEPVIFTPVSSSEIFLESYYAINKMGVVHLDTIIYLDETMTGGIPIKAGEAVYLIGESARNYLVIYGEYKGYILKSHVLIVDAVENTDETMSDKAVSKNENIIEEKVETHVETMIITDKNTEAATTATTAAPPVSLYTTNKQNDSNYSNTLISNINKERKSSNLSNLQPDSSLDKEAAYYCDIFAKKNSIYNISGHSIQAAGKVNNETDLTKVSKSIVKNIKGFNDDKIKKIGVSVIEGEKGNLYYVVIAE